MLVSVIRIHVYGSRYRRFRQEHAEMGTRTAKSWILGKLAISAPNARVLLPNPIRPTDRSVQSRRIRRLVKRTVVRASLGNIAVARRSAVTQDRFQPRVPAEMAILRTVKIATMEI